MCGISGLANWGDRETLTRMTAVQRHRGPNDSGLWEHRSPDGSYIGLGSRRLSILDLSDGGHMPMCNEDGNVWITYNGEIYNARTCSWHEITSALSLFITFAATAGWLSRLKRKRCSKFMASMRKLTYSHSTSI